LVDCGKSRTLHVNTVLYSFSDLHVSSNMIGSQYILAIVDCYWLPKELIMPIQTKLKLMARVNSFFQMSIKMNGFVLCE